MSVTGKEVVRETLKGENVEKNAHYQGNIEVIDYLKDKLTEEELEGFYVGNIIKYISRYKLKNGLEDLKKASVYLNWLIDLKEGNE